MNTLETFILRALESGFEVSVRAEAYGRFIVTFEHFNIKTREGAHVATKVNIPLRTVDAIFLDVAIYDLLEKTKAGK